MKRFSILLVSMLIFTMIFSLSVHAEEEDWKTKPTITSAYEQEKEKWYLEWDGDADLYQIYVDGNNVATVNIKNATINLKEGTHQITIVPSEYVSKDADTRVDLSVSVFSGSIDLEALGVNPKDIIQGTPSDVLKINYSVYPMLNAQPKITDAHTDFDNNVALVVTDSYGADIYKVTIKNGDNINYVEFDANSEDAAEFIEKNNSSVTITLDPEYLKKHECFLIPELNQKYSFSVKLLKRPADIISGEKEDSILLESKEGSPFEYTPFPTWKSAPEITYASQSADGQITLQWTHDDNDLGCEYKIVKIDKLLVIKSGENEIGRTSDKEYVIEDLKNGKYSFMVIPVFSDEEGDASEEVEVEVKNDWVVAPSLSCELTEENQVLLKWKAPESIENYHVKVFTEGNSILKYISLDYKLCDEFDVEAISGDMEYTFTYDEPIDPETGVKLKFEIYGLRHTAAGEEQRSATTSQTIEIH